MVACALIVPNIVLDINDITIDENHCKTDTTTTQQLPGLLGCNKVYHAEPVDLREITCARPEAPPPVRPSRPAYKQVEKQLDNIAETLEKEKPGAWNLWYQKMSHCREYIRELPPLREPARTKCIPDRDVGYTTADNMGYIGPPNQWLCQFFAKGMCKNGRACKYFHRLPTEYDEYHCPTTHTIFGFIRDANRKNVKGRGSLLREDGQKTLLAEFRSAASLYGVEEVKRFLHEGFSVWGPVKKIMYLPTEGVAFIEYFWRASAEFAKDAMRYQYLNPGDPVVEGVMVVTWKPEDTKEMAEKLAKAEEIISNANPRPPTEEEELLLEMEESGKYPNTDHRFAGNNRGKTSGSKEDDAENDDQGLDGDARVLQDGSFANAKTTVKDQEQLIREREEIEFKDESFPLLNDEERAKAILEDLPYVTSTGQPKARSLNNVEFGSRNMSSTQTLPSAAHEKKSVLTHRAALGTPNEPGFEKQREAVHMSMENLYQAPQLTKNLETVYRHPLYDQIVRQAYGVAVESPPGLADADEFNVDDPAVLTRKKKKPKKVAPGSGEGIRLKGSGDDAGSLARKRALPKRKGAPPGAVPKSGWKPS